MATKKRFSVFLITENTTLHAFRLSSMRTIIESILLSFCISYLSIPVIIKIANLKKLYDDPSSRKVHITPVPALGGVAIFASVLICLSYLISFSVTPELQYLIGASVIIFFIGLKDDLLVISPFKKFIGQAIATLILIYKGNFIISSLYGFLGYTELGLIPSIIITSLAILMIINSFNLIDGVNGLAASLGIVSCLFFGSMFYIVDEIGYTILSFATVGSLVAFLKFNWTPAKIFMGDTGSLFLGLVNSVLFIKFMNLGSFNASGILVSQSALIGFSVLFIPVIDTLRVFSVRLFTGKSPFYSDVNHIHHLLLKRGLSHLQVTFILSVLAISYIVLAFNIQTLGINYALIVLFFFGIGIPICLEKINAKNPTPSKGHSNIAPIIHESNVKSLFSTGSTSKELNN